jgi:putative SOS response-associated peptidase YedK
MCGRFTLRTPAAALAERFFCDVPPDLAPRYNVAPTQAVAAIRCRTGASGREFAWLRWGLVPAWARDPTGGKPMINARAETVHEKPAFRSAFRRRRCLILADGYYEWQKMGKAKQPFYIHLADGRPFSLAGLWERWGAAGAPDAIESCTIITTEANVLTQPIHDRMPVILRDADLGHWLDPQCDAELLRSLLVPYAADDLVAEPVSAYVNSPQHDDSQCIAR